MGEEVMTRQVTALILFAALCIPAGITLALWTNHGAWLLLTVVSVIFFMAG